MTLCRNLAEIEAAAAADYEAEFEKHGPRTQEQADRIAAILAPHMPAILAAREKQLADDRMGT